MTIMDERDLEREEDYELRTAPYARFIHKHIAAPFREIRFALPLQNNYARKPSPIRLRKWRRRFGACVGTYVDLLLRTT